MAVDSKTEKKPTAAETAAAEANAPEKQADKLTPATDFAASGAIIEPEIVSRVDMTHASIDNNPRQNSTVEMNMIDPNEPSALTPPEEVVAAALKDQGAGK